MCTVLLVCAASFAYAAPQCSIVPSSIPWDSGDQGTWKTDTYQLTIECTENGSPVQGYQAQFDINLMEGANWENKIATLTVFSTPTDSNGKASLNVPLIHIQKNTDNKYLHICPFDDIQCTGGLSSQSQAAPANLSRVTPFITVASTGCLNTMTGCCQTTITITCCSPNIVLNYCTTTPAGSCATGTTHPDPCTTITTTWDANGTCNYCTGICVPGTLIDLSSFTAKPSNGRVKLEWSTEAEIDNAGFNIYRSESGDVGYEKINPELIAAKGSETKGAKYVFIDNIAKNRKTYFYKLEDIDLNGTSTMHGPKIATPRLILGILGK
jgi:hypothetical protein